MSFWSRLSRKPAAKEETAPQETDGWPNHPNWSALRNEETVQTDDGPRFVWTIPCGDLALPSGRLVACDPFAGLQPEDNPHIIAPQGRFPVVVTLADVSEEQDRSHVREAYASIVFSSAPELSRRAIPLAPEGEAPPPTSADEFVGFPVDSGTACFVDDSVVGPCMPDPDTWYDDLFDSDEPESWFARMDDPEHIREGIANIPLPLGQEGENLILFHSGWGDGIYPVVGSFDAAGNLVAAHIDLGIIP